MTHGVRVIRGSREVKYVRIWLQYLALSIVWVDGESWEVLDAYFWVFLGGYDEAYEGARPQGASCLLDMKEVPCDVAIACEHM